MKLPIIKIQSSKFKVQSLGILFLIFNFSLLTFNSRTARAQTQTFTTIPPRLEVSANPGQFVKKVVQFRNEGDETAYLSVSIQDFIVKSDTGQPEFVSGPASGRWSAASWMSVSPTTLAVLPKAITNVTLSINVPKDALPGGHYAGVLYQSTGPVHRIGTGVGAGSAIQQVIGTLVYLNVAGPVKEEAIVRSFEAPGFSEYGPVDFTTIVQNYSDTHVTPKGQIVIRDMFGKTAAILPLEERNIFPGVSLTYKNSWQEKSPVGRFRADLRAAYGSGRALTATLYFWVFPWKTVLAVLLALAIILLLVVTIHQQILRRQELLEKELEEEKEEIEELKDKLKGKDTDTDK